MRGVAAFHGCLAGNMGGELRAAFRLAIEVGLAAELLAGRADTVAPAIEGSTSWISIACKFSDVAAEQR